MADVSVVNMSRSAEVRQQVGMSWPIVATGGCGDPGPSTSTVKATSRPTLALISMSTKSARRPDHRPARQPVDGLRPGAFTAFYLDLGDRMADAVSVVSMSEYGRTAK